MIISMVACSLAFSAGSAMVIAVPIVSRSWLIAPPIIATF
jgi:hypothetical protein